MLILIKYMKNKKQCAEECKVESKKSSNGLKTGIVAALVPHIGCILFLVFTLLGISAGAVFFQKFLLMQWAFPALIGFSFLLAGISSYFYLRRNCCVNKTRYLTILFGSVIAINALLFFVVFPWAANVSAHDVAGTNNLQTMKLQVAIPCSGHASLIISALNKAGANAIFSLPNYFDVSYDSSKISKSDIINLEIFKEFKAVEVK